MFGLGLPELIVIFIIALLVFGPKKLPDLGKSIGRAMAEFKKASDDFQDSVRTEIKEVEKTVGADEVKKLGQIDLPKLDLPSYDLTDTAKPAAEPDTERSAEPNAETKRKKKKNGEAKQNV